MPHTALIQAATQTLIDHVEELTSLDQAIGDGDHGLNMRRGALAIQAKLPEWQGKTLNETLKARGMTCMSTIGGSSGPVFGTLLVTLSNELPASPDAHDLARGRGAGSPIRDRSTARIWSNGRLRPPRCRGECACRDRRHR